MSWSEAEVVLNQGGVIVFPTDTVWGIGAKLDNQIAVKRFYEIKKREHSKPSQVLISSLEMAYELGRFNQVARELVARHWPGALTVIVPATQNLPSPLTHHDGTVGLRWPAYSPLEALISRLNVGLIASSANVSGGNPPLAFSQIDQQWVSAVDYVVTADEAGGQLSSTIVKITDQQLTVIRHGSVRV